MRIILLAVTGLLVGCVTTPDAPPPPPVSLSAGTAWVAEGKGWAEEAEQVYAEAGNYVAQESVRRPAESWAVVLDLDETVLNNVDYQISRERIGEGFTLESWHDWTLEAAATLVPGAAAFISRVNEASGHVAFVTNRADTEQLATENNLAALGLRRGEDFRVLMTRARPLGPSAKDARYALVPALLAVQGYPDVEIIAFVGDNIGDKPAEPGAWKFFCIDQGAMYGSPCAAVPGPGR